MNMENIGLALEMMGQGMLGIFVVLGVIALLVALMQKIDNRKNKKIYFKQLRCGGAVFMETRADGDSVEL